MDTNSGPRRVTSTSGDVDTNGELVGSLTERIGTAIDPGHYVERPGLNARIEGAGADVATVRRLLRVS